MNTTQEHLAIKDISNDILILKDGGGALVLQVSAVNFGLLSEREQMAIIYSFAQMLNSLSFSIQIVILSERLNISSYIKLLDKAQKAQANVLLSQMINDYKIFIQSTIKENDVLDKKFYLVIPLFSFELGLVSSRTALEQKIKTTLLPRKDQIIRQLARVGLKATQLNKQELIELFYNIYNGVTIEKEAEQLISPSDLAVKLKNPQQNPKPPTFNTAGQNPSQPAPASSNLPSSSPISVTASSKNHPFVVEELSDHG